MKKLHIFVLKSYIGPFILTFFIAIFLLLMQFLWKYIDELVGKGLDASVIAELLLYASASLVPMALPLAILLSSIMSFGNMAEHNELMAIKSAGISLVRIMKPLIVFVVLVCFAAFFFSNNIMPYTNLKMGALIWDVRNQKPEVSVKEGVFSDAIQGYSIKVARKSRKTSMLYEIMIYNHIKKDGNREVTIADSGTMKMTLDKKYLQLTLYSGTSYVEQNEKGKRWDKKEFPHQVSSFEQEEILIDLSGLGFERTDETLFKSHYAMLNLSQLKHAEDSLNRKYGRRQKEFIRIVSTTNYFKRLNFAKTDSLWYETDTISGHSADMDSLIASLPESRQQMVYSSALDYARSTKTYIGSSSTEFDHQKRTIKRYEIEWHRKFTLSFACILLFFIGAPLGAIIRKGGLGMPVVVSVFFFVIYYVINISGEKSAKIGATPSWIGMWLSGLVFLPLGVFLTYKAAHDSTIMNVATYFEFVKYIGKFFGKILSVVKQKIIKVFKKQP